MDWAAIYGLGGLNHSIFYAVNGMEGEWWRVLMLTGTRFGNFYTAFGMYMAVAMVISLWRLQLMRSSRGAMASQAELGRVLLALAAVAVSHVLSQEISETIKHAWPMPRPYMALPEGTVNKLDIWLSAKNDYQSFPSGHAAFSAVLLWGFWPLLDRPFRYVAAGIALWIVVSRMALGVHFPTDLIAGFALGSATILSVRALLQRLANPALSFPRLAR